MFGLMTEATHRRLMKEMLLKLDRKHCYWMAAEQRCSELSAEIDRLRPMADKWQAHLDRAQANFRKGK